MADAAAIPSDAASEDAAYLAPGTYVDSDHPAVVDFAARVAGNAPDAKAAALALYKAVRDEIVYDPYIDFGSPECYRGSSVLQAGRGFCIGKAALLAAALRSRGIPARLAFADVRNHLSTPRLLALLGSDLFVWHGITEVKLGGRWVKATPTFNLTLCQRFGIKPLEFDGIEDSMLHPYDASGRRHMEYVALRGSHADVPLDAIMRDMRGAYPKLFAATPGGDFAAEAAPLG